MIKNVKAATVVGEKTNKGASGWVVMFYHDSRTFYIGELNNTMRNGYGMRTYKNSQVVY